MPRDSINLLPEHFVEHNRARKLWRFWFRSLVLVAVVCAVSVSIAGSISEHARQVALASHQATEPIRQVVDSNRQLQGRVQQLAQLSNQHTSLRSANPPLTLLALLADLHRNHDHTTQVVSIDFADSVRDAENLPTAIRIAQASPTESEAAAGLVRVTFIVSDGQRATEVMRYLRSSGYFKQVSLDSSLEQVHNSHEITFSVRCHF